MTVLVVLWQISLEKDEHCTVIDNSDAERWIVSKKKLNNIVLLLFFYSYWSFVRSLKYQVTCLLFLAARMPCPSTQPQYSVSKSNPKLYNKIFLLLLMKLEFV